MERKIGAREYYLKGARGRAWVKKTGIVPTRQHQNRGAPNDCAHSILDVSDQVTPYTWSVAPRMECAQSKGPPLIKVNSSLVQSHPFFLKLGSTEHNPLWQWCICIKNVYYVTVLGGNLGLSIVYTYACSSEVTALPIEVAWSKTNLWCGIGLLIAPLFSGKSFI